MALRTIAVAAPAALFTIGCSLLTPSAPAIVGAPAIVANRSTLPFCGRETVANDAGFNVAARQCLWDSYQTARPAEFITTQPTIEGDPITWVYRVLGGGRVEVFVDITHDMSGPDPPPRWIRLTCRSLAIIDGAHGQPAFGPGDCDEENLS